MFERISVQQQKVGDVDDPLDLPFLAEAMLFYGCVEVIVNRASLHQLLRAFGPDLLLEFLRRGYLKVKFEANFAGVITKHPDMASESHVPSVFQIDGQELIDILRPAVIKVVGREGKGRRLALKLVDQIESSPIDTNLPTRTAADLEDRHYVIECVERMIRLYVPEAAPKDIRFNLKRDSDINFRIETNVDFSALNKVYHKHISSRHSTLTPAYLLSHFITARKILEDGANAEAEIAVAPVYKELISAKFKAAFQRRDASAEQMATFQRFVFDDGKEFSGALASGERSFHDLLAVLDKAAKFRHWLKGQSPDSELVKNYFRAATEQTWVEKLPTKAARWSIFTGAGVILDALGAGGLGTLGGVALSAADAFVVDKLVKGWKPNQFVEKTLRDFVHRG
jgi:hypothetical protein